MVLLVLMVVMAGCTTYATREPMGQRIDLADKASKQAELLDTLYSRLWIVEEDKGMWVVQFIEGGNSSFWLKFRVFIDVIDEEGKVIRDEFPLGDLKGVVRAWDDKLILHILSQMDKPGMTGACYDILLLSIHKSPEGNLFLTIHNPVIEELKKPRKLADGREISLEIVSKTSQDEGGLFSDSTYLIRSDEKTIADYLSTTSPNVLFNLKDDAINDKNRQFRAGKPNLNYKGRPDFRRRKDIDSSQTQPAGGDENVIVIPPR